jgi:hypothetical protein
LEWGEWRRERSQLNWFPIDLLILEDILSMEMEVLARRAVRRTSTREILMFAEWMR